MSKSNSSTAEDYIWCEDAKLFAHKKNRRFIPHSRARELGLTVPEKALEEKIEVVKKENPNPPTASSSAPALENQNSPAPQNSAPIEVDQSELFTPLPPQADPGPEPNKAPPPAPEPPPAAANEEKKSETGALNIALAQMVWGMILRIFILIFGDGYKEDGTPNQVTARLLPQKFVTAAGTIDENQNVIIAFCEYFDSIGMVKLSPLWNLLLTLAAYFLVRIEMIVLWFKNRKERNAERRATNLRSREKTESPAPPPPPEKPAPAPAQSPPSPPAPPAAPQEAEEQIGGF